ncbi:bifunctional diaminohydroxyphosphoribosylaminopyrimidine deaminase/5-amino-6-(5-phosphoribosylamino)uracil reductase RibD [Haliovirga abyssi]|uniref:Riboflavin biosynthesis protein RibD n=1 Tax=Haliovirga abyssi TaxID=2996794 RepID=A0AAU9E0E4_9FUSO|nr:riboflavin biosynthesis protein RibD [Haliovirga abyssi]
MNDEKYMSIAIELAKKGEGGVNPNPLVGAVVVKNGEIIGRGYHQYFGGPHAEVYALEEAGENAKDATIYVTLEPCSHYGKTPPCADRIVKAGIKRCVIAVSDPNPLVAGRGISKMEQAGIEVKVGVLEKESLKVNEVFMKYITKREAFLFLKSAITLDGKIATKTFDSKWITNEIARNEVHKLRNRYMAVMVGVNTVIQDNPRLTSRIENGRNPYRVIIDPNLRTPLDSNIIKNNKDNKTIIITSKDNEKIEDYYDLVRIVEIEGEKFIIKDILIELAKIGIDSVLVEGGSKVISACFKEKAMDKGVIFIAPKIVGDEKALSFVNGFDITNMSDSLKLKDIKFRTYDDNIGVWFEGVE